GGVVSGSGPGAVGRPPVGDPAPEQGGEERPIALREGAGVRAGEPRTLVLRALGLGDLLTAVPALRALRRAQPENELVLAAPAWLASAARAAQVADVLLPAGGSAREVPAALAWPWPPPRLAVDLHGNGTPSRDALAASAPARLLAYAEHSAPAWRENEHERLRWCRLLRWYGIPADPDDLLLGRPEVPSPAPGAVLVHPGADAGARRWPAARFARVARELRARGDEVVITHGPGELALAHEVAARAGLPARAVPGGASGLPFELLAALVAQARAVVVGDTGVAHLATALAAPSVVLFGPVSPALWGPPPHPRHRALWRPWPGEGARPGDPHGTSPDPRLLRLHPADVLHACARLEDPGPGLPGDEAPHGTDSREPGADATGGKATGTNARGGKATNGNGSGAHGAGAGGGVGTGAVTACGAAEGTVPATAAPPAGGEGGAP
ncbi:glycosyltransferase family 9 protein, partial [Streptomyces sp. PU-14G]|uniref:glycosyltransferase family 9 protein n=1 Tax=Streptomyces sp. PU-14G TaxID=2800808 RepID=UPI0034DEFB9F